MAKGKTCFYESELKTDPVEVNTDVTELTMSHVQVRRRKQENVILMFEL